MQTLIDKFINSFAINDIVKGYIDENHKRYTVGFYIGKLTESRYLIGQKETSAYKLGCLAPSAITVNALDKVHVNIIPPFKCHTFEFKLNAWNRKVSLRTILEFTDPEIRDNFMMGNDTKTGDLCIYPVGAINLKTLKKIPNEEYEIQYSV